MARCVLLRHDLPDGTWHIDWLLARQAIGDDDARDLLTFRVARPELLNAPGTFEATRLPDHRRLYLRYEGEVSGGRGSVRRVGEGAATIERDEPGCVIVEVQFEGARLRYEGRPTGTSDIWRFIVREVQHARA